MTDKWLVIVQPMGDTLDPALHAHFGVMHGTHCVAVVHDYDLARHIARMLVFKKRYDGKYCEGLVWPMLELSRGHYRVDFDTLQRNAVL